MDVYILVHEQTDYFNIVKVFASEEALRTYVKKEHPEFKQDVSGDYVFISENERAPQEDLNIIIEKVHK